MLFKVVTNCYGGMQTYTLQDNSLQLSPTHTLTHIHPAQSTVFNGKADSRHRKPKTTLCNFDYEQFSQLLPDYLNVNS